MNNCKKCNNHKGQQNRKPQHHKADTISMSEYPRMEIHLPELPVEDDSVTISLAEYTDLIAVSTVMGIVTRWAKAHNSTYDKVNFSELLILLAAKEDEK